ncbi:NADP-dependent oxidoreductase [Streptomyces sp. 6N223]|uniref:NADP-dependent oxidoreductase n=1 Tax=Streptomyces sp. 6N223 TaxID=3457412 RepID=UPI003FD3B1C1
MRGVMYHRYGGPEVLEYGELPEPRVGPDSVLVRVAAAGVNPVDFKARSGLLDGMLDAVFPVVPGWDVAGTVVRLGADTPEFRLGDEVMGYVRKDVLGGGSCAEFIAAPVRTLALRPAALGPEEAAGLPLAGLTAYQALVKALRVARGETVLIHAAAGGVGTMAVQIAHNLGARVIGTASLRNHELLRSLGAEPVEYGEGLVERVREVAPGGVDMVLDLVGGEALRLTPRVMADEESGRFVSIVDPAANELGGRWMWVRPDAADLRELGRLAEAGALRVEVAATFPLERTAEAHALIAGGHTAGKIIVTVP